MSSYYYHLVAIKTIYSEPIFRNLFEEQEPKICHEMTGNLNDFVPENHPHYDVECEKSIAGYINDNTNDLEYFDTWGFPSDPFEYNYWEEIAEYFKKNGPLIRIDTNLKHDLDKILKYEISRFNKTEKFAASTTTIMEIYGWMLDNYGRWCYHYVY